MPQFRIRRRHVRTGVVDFVEMEFPSLSDAVEWMEREDENPDREYDIASVALASCLDE